MSALGEVIGGKRVVVCAGAGGVGKTTTSAAIALGAAEDGLRVAVLTIDPARRLADSLGLGELGNDPRRVAGVRGSGELWAMMLDAKRTFDELIESYASDERTRDAVLANRIYKELSTAVAGSQEYMAMEKLYELHEQGLYDLLVLDTPPSRNALDFLDAPERLHRFIDSQALRVLIHPTRTGLRLVSRGTGVVFSVLQRVTGVDVLRDLSEFFQSFGDMSEGFRRRAARVAALLEDAATTFVLVTSPGREAIDEAVFFHDALVQRAMPFGAAIVNRMHELPPDEPPPLDGLVPEALARKVARNFADYRTLAERDWANVRRLADRLGDEPLILLPELDEDVHDLDGLRRIEQHLLA